MALVKHWLGGFLKRHKVRFDPHDWPRDDEAEESLEYVRLWKTALATREVTEAEADEASRSLATTPPNFRREHIAMVVAKVEELRRQRGGGVAGTREAAREASRGCDHCGGDGLASAWAEAPDDANRIPPTIAAFCCCPHGRFMKRSHAEKDPGMLRKILDFGLVREGEVPGWGDWPPDLVRPGEVAVAPAAPSRAAVNAIFRSPES